MVMTNKGIYAKVIADSISRGGVRLTTLELQYHRFVHSEMMTHRMFSRNASSSRAIPIEKMMGQVLDNPAMPIHWGENKPGMQAGIQLDSWGVSTCNNIWNNASLNAVKSTKHLAEQGLHKQVANRLLEPFQWIKVIVTATEWDNFFKLRDHPDAQPEIQELARCMKESMRLSEPSTLFAGEWHLPYLIPEDWYKFNRGSLTQEDLIKCSVARCARVSYNNHDNSSPDIEKDIALADRLLEAGHCSPFEHQGVPMNPYSGLDPVYWEEGVTHMDTNSYLWSNNFFGWIQYRALLAS